MSEVPLFPQDLRVHVSKSKSYGWAAPEMGGSALGVEGCEDGRLSPDV